MNVTATRPRLAFRNVLLTTDLSAASEAALGWARVIAGHYGAELYVTHVISPSETALVPPEYWGATQEAIEEAAVRDMEGIDATLRGVRHKVLLQHGTFWEAVSADLREFRIDLVVMGTHGREGLGRFVLGSVTEEALRRAPCPVLTLGPRATAPEKGDLQFTRILFATHFGPESIAAAAYALSFAEEFGAKLTLLHVMGEEDFDLPADPQVQLRSRTERLHHIVSAEAELVQTPSYRVEFGNAAEEILRVAEEEKADLIVIGAKPTAHVDAATHLGSAVAHRVMASAKCPVLAVRG
ncbi:MAG TPA: universal stress protein [Candidatus Acidoferrales bacterium]|nr:universal stress protein [Candidatus Acidoferrales bacterium]